MFIPLTKIDGKTVLIDKDYLVSIEERMRLTSIKTGESAGDEFTRIQTVTASFNVKESAQYIVNKFS